MRISVKKTTIVKCIKQIQLLNLVYSCFKVCMLFVLLLKLYLFFTLYTLHATNVNMYA